MRHVNGLALTRSIDAGILSYRARKGLEVRSINGYNLYLCPLDDRDDSNFVHGEFYCDIDLEDPEVSILRSCDGNYAFLTIRDDRIIFARDPLGTKPLYYASDDLCISSDPRVMLSLSLTPVEAEPGVLYIIEDGSLRSIPFNPLSYNSLSIRDDCIERIYSLLLESIKRRVKDKRILLGISGIDSIILRRIAEDCKCKVTPAVVCVEGSQDHKYYQSKDVEIIITDEREIREIASIVREITDMKDPMNVSIASIVYILAKHAKEEGYDAIMLGQLADELFGGYARYLDLPLNTLNATLFNDVINAHRRDFIRDEAVSSPFTELLLPYTSLPLVQFALSLDPTLKIRDGVRKFILREVARNLGIEFKEKKAMHFSSGVFKIVSRL